MSRMALCRVPWSMVEMKSRIPETTRKPCGKDGGVETAAGIDAEIDVGIDARDRRRGISGKGMETLKAWSTEKAKGSSVAAAIAGFVVAVAAAAAVVDVASLGLGGWQWICPASADKTTWKKWIRAGKLAKLFPAFSSCLSPLGGKDGYVGNRFSFIPRDKGASLLILVHI